MARRKVRFSNVMNALLTRGVKKKPLARKKEEKKERMTALKLVYRSINYIKRPFLGALRGDGRWASEFGLESKEAERANHAMPAGK